MRISSGLLVNMTRNANCVQQTMPSFGRAEHLVGMGFRLWLTGIRTGDISCWERTWNTYCEAMGTELAREAVGHLSDWVRSINLSARRDIACSPARCRSFCTDECIAIAMVAACQHSACPALTVCAQELLGCQRIDRVVEKAGDLAVSLRSANHVLSPMPAWVRISEGGRHNNH